MCELGKRLISLSQLLTNLTTINFPFYPADYYKMKEFMIEQGKPLNSEYKGILYIQFVSKPLVYTGIFEYLKNPQKV
jgi:hypothetical protein